MICCECGASTNELIASDGTLARCSRCGSFCDSYLDTDGVVTALNVALLRKSAWRHVIHNAEAATVTSLTFVFVLATILEAVSTLICRTWMDKALEHSSSPTSLIVSSSSSSSISIGVSSSNNATLFLTSLIPTHFLSEERLAQFFPRPGTMPPTLQLTRSDGSGAVLSLQDPTHNVFALLVFCVLAEAVLFAVSIASCVSVETTKEANGGSSSSASTSKLVIRSVLLASCAKVALLPCFIWAIPTDLLLLIEIANLLWHYLAVNSLTRDDARVNRWLAMMLYLTLRTSFRLLCGWAPVFGFF